MKKAAPANLSTPLLFTRPHFWLGLAALMLLLYLGALHPDSGGLGGLFYFLTAWALPTLFVVYAATGVAFLFQGVTTLQRSLLLIGLSTAIGLAPALRAWRLPFVHFRVTSSVVNPVHVLDSASQGSRSFDVNDSGPRVKTGFLDGARVSGNEGCGCLYFVSPDDIEEKVISTIGGLVGSTTQGHGEIEFEIATERTPQGGRAQVSILEKGMVQSRLVIEGIPDAYFTSRIASGSPESRLHTDFLSRAMRIFSDTNIWMVGFKSLRLDPLDRILQRFLDQALIK